MVQSLATVVLKPRPLVATLLSACVVSPLFYVPVSRADEAQPAALREVVVSATRTETGIDAVPATISSVDRAAMDKRMPHDEAALLADNPDVVIGRDQRRFGASATNIRGIEANRVLLMVDGVRLPDYYNGGGPSNATAATSDSPEMEFLKRVEVLRGPASSLYGSDALGGVVSYVTLDPRDLLGERSQAGRYKLTWREADQSFQNTVYLAAGSEMFEGLLAVTRRQGDELDNKGSVGGAGYGRELPNPQENKSHGTLAKLIFKPTTGHRLKLSYEDRVQDNKVDILRLSASLPRVTANNGTENSERKRFGLDWEWKGAGVLDRLLVGVFHQQADQKAYTMQRRTSTTSACSGTSSGTSNCQVDMNFSFEQESTGFSLQAEKILQRGALTHSLVFGADWRKQKVEELRDYTITNLATGTVSKSLAGDTYPLQDFAPGTTKSVGFYVQDEIAMLDGRFTLTPGLRRDSIRLEPENLAKQIGSLTFRAASQSQSAFSPKLAALWQVNPGWSIYGQAVNGFRAPNYTEVNGLFYNASQNYATIPNAGLKAERSYGLELGTRINALGGELRLAVYENRYDDFISQERVCNSTGATATCLNNSVRSVYQYVNLDKVRIRGAEVRGAWKLPSGFRLNAAAAYAQGDVISAGQPLNSIEPLRMSVTLNWEGAMAGAPVGMEARIRAASRKSRVDKTDGDYFRTPGYAVADLSAWWQVHRQARVSLAVNNLFDQKYWLWSDVRQAGLTPTEPGPAFYTQPGRNLAASLQLDF